MNSPLRSNHVTLSGHITQYMRFARCTSPSHILLRFTSQNIAYTETLTKIASLWGRYAFVANAPHPTRFALLVNGLALRICLSSSLRDFVQQTDIRHCFSLRYRYSPNNDLIIRQAIV